MEQNATASAGRPRTFDEQAVLGQVADLYWAQGPAATSVLDLERATGLGRSSLYNAFGGKQALFTRALDAYVAGLRALMLEPLLHGTAGAEDLHAFLDRLAHVLDGPHGEHGCLAVATMADPAARDPAVQTLTDTYVTALAAALHAALTRAQVAGELAPSHDPVAAADVLLLGVIGVNVVARAGAPATRRTELIAALHHHVDQLSLQPKSD